MRSTFQDRWECEELPKAGSSVAMLPHEMRGTLSADLQRMTRHAIQANSNGAHSQLDPQLAAALIQ
jgi:hypothetical protein